MPVLPEVGSISVVLPGVILPCRLQRLDHRDADAVLDAGDRVEEFELGEKIGDNALFLGELVEPHQRRVADRLGDGIVDAAAAGRMRGGDGLVHRFRSQIGLRFERQDRASQRKNPSGYAC